MTATNDPSQESFNAMALTNGESQPAPPFRALASASSVQVDAAMWTNTDVFNGRD